eukprot:COSAG05_NODE_7381_length_819_cov_1.643056_1_plen_128_part_10
MLSRVAQGASRLLIFLLLNHAQVGIVMMVYNCTRSKPKRLAEQMDKFNRQQKDLLAMAVFREDEKVVRAWHRARNVVSMRRRIRVTKNQVKNMDSLGVGVGGGGGGTGAAEEGGGDAVITIAPAAAAA